MKYVIILFLILGISVMGIDNAFAMNHAPPTVSPPEFIKVDFDRNTSTFKIEYNFETSKCATSTDATPLFNSNAFTQDFYYFPHQATVGTIGTLVGGSTSSLALENIRCQGSLQIPLSHFNGAADFSLHTKFWQLNNGNVRDAVPLYTLFIEYSNNAFNSATSFVCNTQVNFYVDDTTKTTLVKFDNGNIQSCVTLQLGSLEIVVDKPSGSPHDIFPFYVGESASVLVPPFYFIDTSMTNSLEIPLLINTEFTLRAGVTPNGFTFSNVNCGGSDVSSPFTFTSSTVGLVCTFQYDYTATLPNDVEFTFNEQTKDMTIKWNFGDRPECRSSTEVFINDVQYFYDGLDFPIKLKQNNIGNVSDSIIDCKGEITQNFSYYSSNDEILNFEMFMFFGTGTRIQPLGEIIFSYSVNDYYERVGCYDDDDTNDSTLIDYYEDILGTYATRTDENGCNVILDKHKVTLLEIPITISSDDAEEDPNGNVDLISSFLKLEQRLVGLRFNHISLDQGQIIQSAFIQFTSSDNDDEYSFVKIYGQNDVNPKTFNNTSYNISDRPHTTKFVDWDIPEWHLAKESGYDQQTPDLKIILQELVDKPDWENGNSVAFLIESVQGYGREAYSTNVGGESGLPEPEPTLYIIASLPDEPTTTQTQQKKKSGSSNPPPPPTFGKNTNYKQIVENGFCFNGNCVDVDKYHTEFPLINATVGEVSNITVKAYNPSGGINGFKWIQIILGMPEAGMSISEGEVINTFYLQQTEIDKVEIIDKQNLIANATVTTSIVKCSNNFSSDCLELSYDFIPQTKLKNNVVGINVVNYRNSGTTNFLNDGIEFHGESLLEPLISYVSASKGGAFYPQDRGTVELTLINYSEDLWQDIYGYLWTSDNYKSFRIISDVPVPQKEPDLMWSAMTRINSNFPAMIIHEQERAVLIFDSSKLVGVLDPTVEMQIGKKINKLDDPIVLERMRIAEQEAMKLTKDYTLNQHLYQKDSYNHWNYFGDMSLAEINKLDLEKKLKLQEEMLQQRLADKQQYSN